MNRVVPKHHREEVFSLHFSEAELVLEIEALRGQLNREVGDKYSYEKIQAANGRSAHLDELINEWFAIQAKKRAAR